MSPCPLAAECAYGRLARDAEGRPVSLGRVVVLDLVGTEGDDRGDVRAVPGDQGRRTGARDIGDDGGGVRPRSLMPTVLMDTAYEDCPTREAWSWRRADRRAAPRSPQRPVEPQGGDSAESDFAVLEVRAGSGG